MMRIRLQDLLSLSIISYVMASMPWISLSLEAPSHLPVTFSISTLDCESSELDEHHYASYISSQST